MRFSNINVAHLQTRAGAALRWQELTTASLTACMSVAQWLHLMERLASRFLQTLDRVDQVGAKHTIALRNIVAHGLVGTALTLAALSARPWVSCARKLSAAEQTDLGEYRSMGLRWKAPRAVGESTRQRQRLTFGTAHQRFSARNRTGRRLHENSHQRG